MSLYGVAYGTIMLAELSRCHDGQYPTLLRTRHQF